MIHLLREPILQIGSKNGRENLRDFNIKIKGIITIRFPKISYDFHLWKFPIKKQNCQLVTTLSVKMSLKNVTSWTATGVPAQGAAFPSTHGRAVTFACLPGDGHSRDFLPPHLCPLCLFGWIMTHPPRPNSRGHLLWEAFISSWRCPDI